MLTQQEAAQTLSALVKETVQHWNIGGTLFHRRFLDADELDVSAVTWSERDGDNISLSASWWYMDAFLDAARHESKDLDGIPWPEAVVLMEEVAEGLTGRDLFLSLGATVTPFVDAGISPRFDGRGVRPYLAFPVVL